MNGSTNVQISAMATFFSVFLLWLAGYFMPDLMDTAPEMLGELFTGALIVAAGLIFKPDAGTKLLPGTGSNTYSPVLVGLIAGALAVLVMSGCAGTQNAYKAADGLSETAYVVGEHYYANVRAINIAAQEGGVTADELQNLQGIALQTRPAVMAMVDAAAAYEGVRSAENERELSDALALASISITRLVAAVQAIGKGD